MKKLIGIALLGLTIGPVAVAEAQVSVGVGLPGLYGRVNIGGYASPPPVLNQQPVYAGPGRAQGEPLYLHVRPGEERHWRQHCRAYDACGRPVYFVQHDWYKNVYARDHHDGHDDRDHHDGHDGHDGHDNDRDHGRN